MSNSFREDWRVGSALLGTLLAIGIIGAVIVYLMTAAPAQQVSPPSADLYADIPFDPKLLQIDKTALTEAYHDQLKHLFDIWLRGQAQSTKEITTGLKIARRAYGIAAGQIAKREAEAGPK
jgi:uncharacterized membrane protein